MDIKKAYEILNVSENISDADLKNTYKKLAVKYHPDVYKEDPNKFKEINEAYQLILDYKAHPEKYAPTSHGFWEQVVDLGGDVFFNGFPFGFKNRRAKPTGRMNDIEIAIDISFQDSVLGCNKHITFTRDTVCNACNGNGEILHKNNCTSCDGFGKQTQQKNNVFFQGKCNVCNGKNIKKEDCKKCNHTGVITETRDGSIDVPPGVMNGHSLRLNGEGHQVMHPMFGVMNTNVIIHIRVSSFKDFRLVGQDVISNLNISLLEALQGVQKDVETIYGTKQIYIQPKTKHLDQVKISGCGVQDTNGFHIVNLHVIYPNNVSNLIKALSNDISNSVQ